MRVLHTGDWHAGKVLAGLSRTPEIRDALRELLEIARTHAVDVVLVAGDLFDSRHPSPEAEAAVNEFFRDASRAGLRVVAISGNHDNPMRMDALAHLAGLNGIHLVGSPRSTSNGGTVALDVRGTPVKIACLPFLSHRQVQASRTLFDGLGGEQVAEYQENLRKLTAHLCGAFAGDSVNILMMHGTTDGAELSGSEHTFHSSNSYALNPASFPSSLSYLAFGHIHKPQAIKEYSEDEARYCGSLIQLDFGEAGEQKYAYVVELEPGRPARTVAAAPITSGRPLKTVRVTLAELDALERDLRSFGGHLKIDVQADAPTPGLRERIRERIPNALIIKVSYREAATPEVVDTRKVALEESFERFWRENRGSPPDERVMRMFADLQEEAGRPEEEATEVLA